jgi:prophage regulatory protein|tara:strand:- start:212 stop:430 length:219 start_codon:yes stop_codon:yes gene_type:complete
MSSLYRVIKMKELVGEVGISRSYIYALQARGEFPTPISLVKGGRATGYLRSEIDDWMKGRIAATRGNVIEVA